MKKHIILVSSIILLTILAVILYINYKNFDYQKDNNEVNNNIVNNEYDKWKGIYALSKDNITIVAQITKVNESFYLSVDITDTTSNSNIYTKSSQGIITLLNNSEAKFDTKNIVNNINIDSINLINDMLYVNLLDNSCIALEKLDSLQQIQEIYQKVAFSYFDVTLNEISLDYTNILLSVFGNEINREYYSFESETIAKIYYEKGVCLYVSFKEDGNTIDSIVGYDVTNTSIIVARGLHCGNSMNDVISSFLNSIEYSSIDEKEHIQMIYGVDEYMRNRAYIEYNNGLPESIVYKNEESTIIFWVDNNMNISKISYTR